MTLLESVQAVLQPLAAGGCWYQVNESQPPATPFIVFSRIPSAENNTLQGASDLQNTRVQVDVYSRAVDELLTLGAAVKAAMTAAAFTNVLLASRDLYEADTKLRRTSFEYSVWSTT